MASVRGVDFTGMAYLVVIGVTGFIGWKIYRSSGKAGEVIGNAVQAVKETVGTVAAAVNPVNPENIVNQGATAVFHAASGNNVDSIGTWLYGITHPDVNAEQAAPQIQLWTVADQEDAELGSFFRGIPAYTAIDQEDADAGAMKMTDTAGGASLSYRLKMR